MTKEHIEVNLGGTVISSEFFPDDAIVLAWQTYKELMEGHINKDNKKFVVTFVDNNKNLLTLVLDKNSIYNSYAAVTRSYTKERKYG